MELVTVGTYDRIKINSHISSKQFQFGAGGGALGVESELRLFKFFRGV